MTVSTIVLRERRPSGSDEQSETFANIDLENVLLNIALGFLPNSQSPFAQLPHDTFRFGICEAVMTAFWGARSKVGLVTPSRAPMPYPQLHILRDDTCIPAPSVLKRRRLQFVGGPKPKIPSPVPEFGLKSAKRQRTVFTRSISFTVCRTSFQDRVVDPFYREQGIDRALHG